MYIHVIEQTIVITQFSFHLSLWASIFLIRIRTYIHVALYMYIHTYINFHNCIINMIVCVGVFIIMYCKYIETYV